jgi:hypothetical protein
MSARILLVSSVLVLAMAITARPAAAEDPGKAFNGRIMTSAKRFPQTAKSPTAYTQMIRKQSQTNFNEDKTNHTWLIYFAAFLKSPLNDVEYVIKFFDVSPGQGQRLLATSENFNDERGQTTIVSKITLDKKAMGVNKDILMTLENKGKIYASTKIKLLGEGERFTGKVNFSEDEANGSAKSDE